MKLEVSKSSIVQFENRRQLYLAKIGHEQMICLQPDNILKLAGEQHEIEGQPVFIAPKSHENAEIIRNAVPWTAPSPLNSGGVSFGLGDRLGIAAPGHISAVKNYQAQPVFAQQSVRELDLTGRSYEEIIDAATWSVLQEGYRLPWSADGDHLKSGEWVRKACEAGCTMITADLSDTLHPEYERSLVSVLQEDYKKIDDSYRKRIESEYLSKQFALVSGRSLTFTEKELMKTVLLYRDAIEFAESLFQICGEFEQKISFEISIDETLYPTSPEAHMFVARELQSRGVEFTSIAPRFVGEFQKGIDYIGDLAQFEKDLSVHQAIAETYNYKLSVHSGSDKFSVFPAIGKICGNDFHIKTSGTNWLVALKTIAAQNPVLFRQIHFAAKKAFETARGYYYVTTELDDATDIDSLTDEELTNLFDKPGDRQILHISYGELFKNPEMKDSVFSVLTDNLDSYWAELNLHIDNHFTALNVRKRGEN